VGKVVRREFDQNPVARQDADEVHPDLSGNVRENAVPVRQLDAKHRVGQRFDDRSFNFDRLFFGRRRLRGFLCGRFLAS